ncbi:ABC transporter ATP-binding protein [Erysipelothrix sp. HDW6C]|uniref:ABC transporter ATP-binding protein n=1 Tax=Erysipelothrix sp. HDW6C TaxID=2714930 RepID=UPI00140D8EE9|nr:ABC transporter ATP-binding protein [Erysipelothrix sp. HDW6C]QIK69729.1 ABC transporter ATP-binding protein [Erysipelothrix sp. HDW6C]
MSAEITISNLNFRYQEDLIIKNFSHIFLPNTYTMIVGPSGCGKTTLLKLIGGFLKSQEGTILYNGSSYEGFPNDASLILQEGTLLPWLSVQQNIALGVKLTHSQHDLQDIIHDLGIESLLDSYPRQLSGGQRQRVEIARALATNPQLLILDEATSALDMITKEQIQELLKSLKQKYQMSIIQVTHDIEEAAFLGESIVMMQNETVSFHQSPFAKDINARQHPEFYDYCFQLRQAFKGGR